MVQVPHIVPRGDGTFDVVRDDRPVGGELVKLAEGLTEQQADDALDGYQQALELEE